MTAYKKYYKYWWKYRWKRDEQCGLTLRLPD